MFWHEDHLNMLNLIFLKSRNERTNNRTRGKKEGGIDKNTQVGSLIG